MAKRNRSGVGCAMLAMAVLVLCAPASAQPAAPAVSPALTAQDWAQVARLPELNGLWLPDPLDKAFLSGPAGPAWTPRAAAEVAKMQAEDAAGRPRNIFINCLPEGMPSYLIMTLNALEILTTPGRVTWLGEFDPNRMRRIYTDGRGHPEDPDLTFNGHSVGRWEGEVLVVDTVALLPQVYLPLGQSVGVPNNGGMHLVERIRLTGPDTLQDELVIDAPKVLTAPWRVVRTFHRTRRRSDHIVEASCRRGDFTEAVDADGDAVFAAVAKDDGGALFADAPAAAPPPERVPR